MEEDKDLGLEQNDQYYGVYRGIVANNQDPKNLGRLQLKCPAVYGEDTYEEWAFPKGIFAGKGIGSFWIPNNGDMVWVSFEGGDPRFPIWEYGWWRDEDKIDGAKPEIKVLQSTKKHRIELDDENNLIRVKDMHGNIVELNENGVSIVSENISLGSLNESAEPAVLGDTLHNLLKEFLNDIGSLKTITTSSGVTYAIQTAANWSAVKSKWETKWEDYKSSKVSLD